MKKSCVFLLMVITLCALNFFTGCQEKQAAADPEKPALKSKTPATAALDADEEADTESDAPAGNKKGTPNIVFENVIADMGKMEPGEYYDLEFPFTNRGNGELIIDKTHATCGCTIPKLDKKNYTPGESGVIKVRYHAQKSAGKVNKAIDVYTNEPKRNTHKLNIAGYVELTVAVDPKVLHLSLKKPNAAAPQITVKSLKNEPFSISEIRDYNKTITFDFDPTKKATEFVLTPKIDMDKLKEKPNGALVIKTLTPAASQLSISYEAPEIVEISRPRIILQGAHPGEVEEKEIWITSNYGDNFEIESMTSRNNIIEAVSQEKVGNKIKLIVKITPPDPAEISRRHFTDMLDLKIKIDDDIMTQTISCNGWYGADVASAMTTK